MSRIWPLAMTNWKGFPSGASGKEPACWCRRYKKHRVQPLGQEDPQRRAWQSTPGFLPRESHGQRSLAGYSPLGRRVGLKQLSTHCTRDMHYIHDKPKAKAFTFKDLKCASNSWCCLRMPCEFRKFSKTVPGKRPTQTKLPFSNTLQLWPSWKTSSEVGVMGKNDYIPDSHICFNTTNTAKIVLEQNVGQAVNWWFINNKYTARILELGQ